MPQMQFHRGYRTGWMRAAVLGADDGIVSTASLILGVAAADAPHWHIMLAGVAGLFAGAMAMAAGEYVSVSSQRDVERADLALERRSLAANQPAELAELAGIYTARGLEPELARQVAEQLTARDALAAHARDELGLTSGARAKPLQAAGVSAVSFAAGAILPLTTLGVAPAAFLSPAIALASLLCLALLGGFAARAGGAPVVQGASRVVFWSAIAMIVTAFAGSMFHLPA